MRITALCMAAVTLSVMAFSNASAQALMTPSLKIGYINSADILEKYSCAKNADAQLQTEVGRVEQEAKNRATELQTLQDQLEKQGMLLTAERKKELTDSLQKKYMQYQEYGQKKQNDLMNRRVELLKPVQDTINKIINRIGKDQNYDFIFDAINGSVVYAKDQYDVTKSIIDMLPACAPKSSGKSGTEGSKKKK